MKFSEIAALKTVSDDAIIEKALMILEERAMYKSEAPLMSCPDTVKSYLRLKIGSLEHEEFFAVFMDARNAVISMDSLFKGTINQTSVYPREVVKAAIKYNAVSVIIAHNHPSGATEPSTADINLTNHLKKALELVDVKVLDHIVVTQANALSFAERGLL